ncbi:MAG TPA: tRNA uridine-5-carboxymethylaminomethyl(34) synthesis GTPase MnmE [Candidatus Paceibacterota bacterium]
MLNRTAPKKLETIAAIATAAGRGSIGVVRVSGVNLQEFGLAVTGRVLEARRATLCPFLDGGGYAVDQGIALYFPGPHSYTGEDVLEFQGHGGPAVLQLVLQRCVDLGARLARPGEFTERAFLNDKMDLAQAESVADLIDASTTQAARTALRSLQGEFSLSIHSLVDRLIELRMLVEAMLDFPEEEIDDLDVARRNSSLSSIQDQLQSVLKQSQQGSLLREGAHVVLVGQPNVGKSSLLNRLSGEDIALVSDIAGTTRDVIRQSLQINGIPLHVIDTAGLRESQDTVEKMGIERTRAAAGSADLILLLLDARHGITAADQEIMSTLPSNIPRLHVYNKADLLSDTAGLPSGSNENEVYLSAKSGVGLEVLRERLLKLIGWHNEGGLFMARERHIRALKSAQQHLDQAAGEIRRSELFAEELRLAQDELSSITGEFTPDDLLGEIFSRFCVGK